MDETITVYGTARRRVAPDLGTWQAVVEARGVTEREAYGACAAALTAVLGAVDAASADDVEVSAGGISVGQEWDDTGRRRVGAVASGTVSVRGPLDALAAAGQSALDAGAVRLDGPFYEVGRVDAIMDELSVAAVGHARERAAQLAAAAGRVLGEVVRVVDGMAPAPGPGGGPEFAKLDMQAMAVGAGPVSPSLHELQAHVTVTLRLV